MYTIPKSWQIHTIIGIAINFVKQCTSTYKINANFLQFAAVSGSSALVLLTPLINRI